MRSTESPSGTAGEGLPGFPTSQSNRGRLFILAASVLWSLSGVITKGLDLEPTTIAVYRSLFAGLALLPLVKRQDWVFRPVMLVCVIAFGAMTGMYISAIKYTTAANAIFLQCTGIFWLIPLGVLLLRELPDRRALGGITLATAGSAAIVLWGYDHNRPGEGLGVALALASGFAYASVVVGLRGLRALNPVWLSAFNNLGGAIVLGCWILAVKGSLPGPGTPTQTATLLGFGVVQMAIPYALFAKGLRQVSAAEAGLIALTEPVLTPLWVYLAFREMPLPATWLGGALLLTGVAIRYLPRKTGKDPADAPAV